MQSWQVGSPEDRRLRNRRAKRSAYTSGDSGEGDELGGGDAGDGGDGLGELNGALAIPLEDEVDVRPGDTALAGEPGERGGRTRWSSGQPSVDALCGRGREQTGVNWPCGRGRAARHLVEHLLQASFETTAVEFVLFGLPREVPQFFRDGGCMVSKGDASFARRIHDSAAAVRYRFSPGSSIHRAARVSECRACMADEPQSIPDLLRAARTRWKLSQRSASMNMGFGASTVNRWEAGALVPDPESCRIIAAWAGYPEEFVLRLAGHLSSSPQDLPAPPELDVIPELAVLLRAFSADDQRRYLLPIVESAIETVRALREDLAAAEVARADAGPPGEGPPRSAPRPRRRPRQSGPT